MKKILSKVAAFWRGMNDKVKHTIVCAVGSFIFGYGFGIGAGIAAEYKDSAWGGKWDWWDLLADAAGTIIGSSLRFLIFNRF